MQSAPAESPLIGLALDNKYRVLRLIGRGGMGEVYEAEHVTLGKRVAVKLMLEKYTGDGEALARFTREALAASRIGDPHIIDVDDIGTAPDGRAFVVMELLHGQPLSRVIEQSGPMPPQRALAIMRQVLRAVGAAHAKGIVHRDLKPDNIFLLDGAETADFVKLLDFGISKVIDPDLASAATKLTTTGVVMGTPLYMAPEQAMGIEIDHHADIYACGVILYEMLAGRPPFEGATYPVLVAKLLTSDPPLLSELRPTLAPKLVAAVHRALEKEPEQRFATADAFAAALPQHHSASAMELSATMHAGATVPAARAARRSGRRLLVAAGILVALAAAAGVALVVTRGNATPTEPAAGSATGTTSAPALTATTGTTAPVATGTLEIGSEPAGATIVIDGHAWGPTPRTITLAPGSYVVRLELAGYQPFERSETITAGAHRAVLPWLRPVARPQSGKGEFSPARAKPPAATTGRRPRTANTDRPAPAIGEGAATPAPPPASAGSEPAPSSPASPGSEPASSSPASSPSSPAPGPSSPPPEPTRTQPMSPEAPTGPKRNPYLGR